MTGSNVKKKMAIVTPTIWPFFSQMRNFTIFYDRYFSRFALRKMTLVRSSLRHVKNYINILHRSYAFWYIFLCSGALLHIYPDSLPWRTQLSQPVSVMLFPELLFVNIIDVKLNTHHLHFITVKWNIFQPFHVRISWSQP